MIQNCTHCGSISFKKNGSHKGVQRYCCLSCNRFFSDQPRKFDYADKKKALEMYLNNVGIRKTALFIGASPALIVRWIKDFFMQVSQQLLKTSEQIVDDRPDVIEMDEIYTFVKKKRQRAVVWCAYSRRANRLIAFHIGEGIKAACAIYHKTKELRPNIVSICTDANSCYDLAFGQMGIKESHIITKKETHRIESANSSIRDNLARFNRRSKRFSKSWKMLKYTLTLFLQKHWVLTV